MFVTGAIITRSEWQLFNDVVVNLRSINRTHHKMN